MMSTGNSKVDVRTVASDSEVRADRKAGDLPRLSSQALFHSAREIIIEHAGVEYRLRLTSQDKLILTK